MKICSFIPTIFFVLSATAGAFADTWDTTWGPVTARVDSSNTFIAYYNDEQDGIIVMSPRGNYYEGWWARTGNCNCPQTATTRSGYTTSCYGSISGYLETEYQFSGNWVNCRSTDGGTWDGRMR